MKLSRDAWVLIVVLAMLAVGSFYVAVGSYKRPDTPSSYSTGKRGTKALYMLLQDIGFRVGRQTGALDSVPPDASVIFLLDAGRIVQEDAAILAKWVKKGNTLIFAATDWRLVPTEFSADMRESEQFGPVRVRPERGKYSHDVRMVSVDPRTYVDAHGSLSPIVKDRHGTVGAEHSLGNGRIIVFGDPSIFANSRIREEDNVVLVTNLIYRNAAKDDLILFAEYNKIVRHSERSKPIFGTAGKLALAQIGFAIVVLLFSVGRRFGAIHPLSESERRPRGWEFVRAIAALYSRAEAREVALGSIYRSFRMELMLKFGAPDDATPEQAADAVIRSREIDRARLVALLARCEQVTHAEKITDGEAIALAGAIEECRRELGIARREIN